MAPAWRARVGDGLRCCCCCLHAQAAPARARGSAAARGPPLAPARPLTSPTCPASRGSWTAWLQAVPPAAEGVLLRRGAALRWRRVAVRACLPATRPVVRMVCRAALCWHAGAGLGARRDTVGRLLGPRRVRDSAAQPIHTGMGLTSPAAAGEARAHREARKTDQSVRGRLLLGSCCRASHSISKRMRPRTFETVH